jgi:hypothetical protein
MFDKLRRVLPVLPVLLLLLALGQGCSDANAHTVEIDVSKAPQVLAGAQVLIDGEVVGVLPAEGSATLASFGVRAGEHTVELRKEGYESQPFQLSDAPAGDTSSLKADMATWLLDGQIKNALILSR